MNLYFDVFPRNNWCLCVCGHRIDCVAFDCLSERYTIGPNCAHMGPFGRLQGCGGFLGLGYDSSFPSARTTPGRSRFILTVILLLLSTANPILEIVWASKIKR